MTYEMIIAESEDKRKLIWWKSELEKKGSESQYWEDQSNDQWS